MVKLPEKAPDWKIIAKKDFKRLFTLLKNELILPTLEKSDRLYYYWDKIRCQPLPPEFDKKEVWAVIRLKRHMSSNTTPIDDVKGLPFTFWLPDDIQKKLHLIDQDTGGNLTVEDPRSDKNSTAKYMISSLMEEAITSSQIEGALATIKDAKKMLLENRKPKSRSEKMIYNNFKTMESLKDICHKTLDINLLLLLHKSISEGTLDSPDEEGRFRTEKDDVSVMTNYGEVLFTPPKAKEIIDRLQELIKFANDVHEKPFVHPVIKAILLHFWMAYIHPFTDGNGRMARTLFYWYMLKHRYWLFEYTSISKTILKHTTKYANAYLYTEHDDNDLTYFIHFHIEVIMEAVNELKNHIQTCRKQNQQLQADISAHPDLNLRQSRIVRYILAHPQEALTIKMHQNLNQIAYQSARNDLLELAEKNWLKTIKKGKTFYFILSDTLKEEIETKRAPGKKGMHQA